ncbi:MAG: PEP-utilizing enzyme [bacterium]|nr:PEP-utilizing enzyme [bacterium]
MNPEKIKEKVLQFKWEFWVDRPFGAFLMSLFREGHTRAYMRKVGVDAEWPATLFQKGAFYKSDEIWDVFERELQAYLDEGGTVFDVVKNCEKYLTKGKEQIEKLLSSPKTPAKKLEVLYDILTQIMSFVWLAHGFEHLYAKIVNREIPKYMSGDLEKNVGDISFPTKKNAHYYFEQALRGKMSLEKVHEKFAWIKARGGFADGFTIEELAQGRARLQKESGQSHEFIRPEVPPELQELISIAQELVYFRTLRTDILYELMWLSRPIMTEIAKSFGLTFSELRDHSALDLMAGKIEKYEYGNFSAISYEKEFSIFHEPVLIEKKYTHQTELKGAIAFKGIVRGIVKIVMIAHEIGKVKEGDILVAPTTAPSYIIGMQKAQGFITDEGGITSHAAIVAREMKKPCIIGTKIATKVLKDGDLVEVDSEQGIVRIIKKA